jgi:hypothetical protein
MSVFREGPQRSIGEPVDLLDPETIASIAAVVSRLKVDSRRPHATTPG